VEDAVEPRTGGAQAGTETKPLGAIGCYAPVSGRECRTSQLSNSLRRSVDTRPSGSRRLWLSRSAWTAFASEKFFGRTSPARRERNTKKDYYKHLKVLPASRSWQQPTSKLPLCPLLSSLSQMWRRIAAFFSGPYMPRTVPETHHFWKEFAAAVRGGQARRAADRRGLDSDSDRPRRTMARPTRSRARRANRSPSHCKLA